MSDLWLTSIAAFFCIFSLNWTVKTFLSSLRKSLSFTNNKIQTVNALQWLLLVGTFYILPCMSHFWRFLDFDEASLLRFFILLFDIRPGSQSVVVDTNAPASQYKDSNLIWHISELFITAGSFPPFPFVLEIYLNTTGGKKDNKAT